MKDKVQVYVSTRCHALGPLLNFAQVQVKTAYLIFLLLILSISTIAQNKMGNRWVVGGWRAMYVEFDGTNKPELNVQFDSTGLPQFPYYYTTGHSNICDSSSGKLLFSTTGMLIHDTTGAIMQNGDSLVDNEYYDYSFYPSIDYTQGSIILPKGSNTGQYYLFIPTISDSAWNYYWPLGGAIPYDQLLVNVIDMNANGGLGSVVVKKKPLLKGVAIHKTMMQACRHSNGVDWWLLKQGEYDTNRIYRYLVKADTIQGPWIQSFPEPNYPSFDLVGQYAFSSNGKKFASIQGKLRKLFVADFDRCTGELSNQIVVNIPIDSSTIPNPAPQYLMDSVNGGVCFSPNGQFVYVSKRWNIYQYEYQQPDSVQAWCRIQHGPDTTYQQFQYYSHLTLGIDNKIYIGNWGGSAKQWSVINDPDNKGVSCNFCRKCLRLDSAVFFTLMDPPNMPDYNLSAEPGPCWPLNNSEFSILNFELEVYPNPTSTLIYLKTNSKEQRYLYNSVGQLLFSTYKDEIDVKRFTSGVYYLKCGNAVRKVMIE